MARIIREISKTKCIKCTKDYISNCSYKGKSKDIKYILCEGNHKVRSLQEKFLFTLRRKVVIPKLQSQTVQRERCHASVIRKHNQLHVKIIRLYTIPSNPE